MRAAEPDPATVIAIASVAYVSARLLHETLGHGGACLLTGQTLLAVSAVYYLCDGGGRLVASGGGLVNLVAGLLCLLAARGAWSSAHLRYLLWLTMTVSLLQAGGALVYSGVANMGDWADVVEGLRPSWLWRIALTVLGAGCYWLFVRLALREMQPLLGSDGTDRRRRARTLTVTAYVAGGVLSCLAGLTSPSGPWLGVIAAAAASFGETSGLVWMWQTIHDDRPPTGGRAPPPISRSRGWIVAGSVLSLLVVSVGGAGVRLR